MTHVKQEKNIKSYFSLPRRFFDDSHLVQYDFTKYHNNKITNQVRKTAVRRAQIDKYIDEL